MRLPSYFNRRLSLTALFFLLLVSILDIAIAAPLPQNGVDVKSLAKRGTYITQAEYQAYLLQYFPNTGNYIEYTANSVDQVEAFQAKNPGYYQYADFYEAKTASHPWYKAFEGRDDDAEAASKAISTVATGELMVFGGADYVAKGAGSFYTTEEAPINKQGVLDGRLKSINHMAKDATSPSQVMAKEDGTGKFTWQPGYQAGTPNNSGSFGTCTKRSAAACDAPPTYDNTASSQPYGDTATQETHAGDTATPQDPVSTGGESSSETSSDGDPAATDGDPDVHI